MGRTTKSHEHYKSGSLFSFILSLYYALQERRKPIPPIPGSLWKIINSKVPNAKRICDGNLGGGFKYCLCSPLFGEDFQFD